MDFIWIYMVFDLVPNDNGKQHPNESYIKKYQKHIVYSYGLCVDDNFSKFLKSCLGEDEVYSFINSMIEESHSCSEVIKEHFNKELVMTKKDNEDFKNSVKC